MPIEKVTVSRDDRIYEFVPDVAQLPDGTLVCIYRESDGHSVQHWSGLVTRRSIDGGHTWSERTQIVQSFPNEEGVVLKWNCPRIRYLSDGRLVALCDVMPVPPNEDTDLTNSKIVMWFSDDAGVSWSEPVHTPIFGIVPDKLLELPSGTWLVATHVRMKNGQYMREGQATEIVHRSEDKGKTWEGPFIVGHDERYYLCEGSILALPDGELVCYMRENSRKGLPAFKSFSKDEGRTWEGVYPTPMDGCHRPVSGLLPDGRVLITYRYQQGGGVGKRTINEPSTWRGKTPGYWARNTFAYLETVESAKARDLMEQGGIILPIDHDRSPRSDSGYTGWVAQHDGRIFCVNYIVDDAPMAQIRGYWFSPDDF